MLSMSPAVGDVWTPSFVFTARRKTRVSRKSLLKGICWQALSPFACRRNNISGETKPAAAKASSSKARPMIWVMIQKTGLSSRLNVYVFLHNELTLVSGRGRSTKRSKSYGRFLFLPDLVFVNFTPNLTWWVLVSWSLSTYRSRSRYVMQSKACGRDPVKAASNMIAASCNLCRSFWKTLMSEA